MYTTKDNKSHVKVSWTLRSKSNVKVKELVLFFFKILDLEKVRIDTNILSVLHIQPEIRKVIIVYIYDLGFEGQPSRSSNFF